MQILFAAFLTLLLFLVNSPVTAQQSTGFADNNRNEREMVQALEAYAVYKMGQYEEAFARFHALAKVGNDQGMLNVANMYAAGVGVAADQTAATHWYGQAAKNGSVIGMEQYAARLGQGTGTPRDIEASKFWRNRIQSISGVELQQAAGSSPSMAEAIPLIDGKLQAIDQAADNQSASGVVRWIDEHTRLLVVLPKTRNWATVNKQQLSALWQAGFNRSGSYSYQRSGTEHSAAGNGMIHTHFLIREEWRTADDKASVLQRIEIKNDMLLEMQNNTVFVREWKLHIRQSP